MKIQNPLCIVLAAALGGCGTVDVVTKLSSGGSDAETLVGSTTRSTQSYDIDKFSKIEASSCFEIRYATGHSTILKIKAPENIFSHIEVASKGGVLQLSLRGNVQMSGSIEVEAQSPSLNGIELSGAAIGNFKGASGDFDAKLDGASKANISGNIARLHTELSGSSELNLLVPGMFDLSGGLDGASHLDAGGTVRSLDIQCTGNSDVKLTRLDAQNASAELDGASVLIASGKADTLKASASGASSLKLHGLEIKTGHVTADGASQVQLGKSGELTLEAAGASSITYEGNPRVSKETSGASSINGSGSDH